MIKGASSNESITSSSIKERNYALSRNKGTPFSEEFQSNGDAKDLVEKHFAALTGLQVSDTGIGI